MPLYLYMREKCYPWKVMHFFILSLRKPFKMVKRVLNNLKVKASSMAIQEDVESTWLVIEDEY